MFLNQNNPKNTLTKRSPQALHALEPKIRRSHFHIPIVQNQLTRELSDSFVDLHDEVDVAFSEKIVLPNEGVYTSFVSHL